MNQRILLLDKIFAKLTREYDSLKTLLHGGMHVGGRASGCGEGEGSAYCDGKAKPRATNAQNNNTTNSFTVTNATKNTKTALVSTCTTSGSSAHHMLSSPEAINNSGGRIEKKESCRQTATLILPAERAEAISRREWNEHSDFLLNAAEPHDPLFHHLARVALFCQSRAGGADLTVASDGGNKEEVEEEIQRELEETMAAVEYVRQDLDDRCRRVREYVSVLDEKALEVYGKEGLAIEEDVLSISMMNRRNNNNNTRDRKGGTKEKEREGEEMECNSPTGSEAAGESKGVAGNFVPITCTDDPESVEQPTNSSFFSSSFSFFRTATQSKKDKTVAPTNRQDDGVSDAHKGPQWSFNSLTSKLNGGTTAPKHRRLKFTALRYAELKSQCMSLLQEGRSSARLFTILDDVAAFCCANGHALEAICIIPREEIERMRMRGGCANSTSKPKPPQRHTATTQQQKQEEEVSSNKASLSTSSYSTSDRAVDKGGQFLPSDTAPPPPRQVGMVTPSSSRRAPPPKRGNTNTTTATKATTLAASSSSSPPSRPEAHVVRLGNGMLATVMVEVSVDEMDVEAEARRLREVQELAAAMQEVRDLQNLIAIETQRQGDALAVVEDTASEGARLAAKARKHLTKAAKHKAVFISLAGGLLGAAIGGPIGLVAGAKSAAAIAGASAIGGVTTAVVTKIAASSASQVDIDPVYEEEEEKDREERKRTRQQTAVERRAKETENTEARRLMNGPALEKKNE